MILVGTRVKAAVDIIEPDYHKGDRILARKGAFGVVESVTRSHYHVRFDHMLVDRLTLDSYEIEPANILDQMAWAARDDG